MIPVICALITGAILSMPFANTRIIGIICVTVLTFLYPIPMVIAVLFGVGFFYYRRRTK